MDSPHYHGKNDILNSLSPLEDELRAVGINRERLTAFASRIDSLDFPEPHWDFPSFDDSAEWGGHRLLFFKRAQLAPAMLFERWKGTGAGAFNDIGELTASADYKIPQVLRRLEILEYSPDL